MSKILKIKFCTLCLGIGINQFFPDFVKFQEPEIHKSKYHK